MPKTEHSTVVGRLTTVVARLAMSAGRVTAFAGKLTLAVGRLAMFAGKVPAGVGKAAIFAGGFPPLDLRPAADFLFHSSTGTAGRFIMTMAWTGSPHLFGR
jgi:hypothetical protein